MTTQNPPTPPANSNPPVKSFTSNFELQTKIRVIIQQVLAATIRKLSHFGDKIDKFQQYFITFRERFQTAERQRAHQQEQMALIESAQTNIRRDINFSEIRYNQDKERLNIVDRERRDQYHELQKLIKGLTRQNQNVTSELSKTKSKFIEYSNTISTLKEEVSWKITKYLQETAQSHTQMKVFAQKIKNEYFNINLMVEKQKEKYDQILLKYEEDTAFKDNVNNQIDQAHKENAARIAAIKTLNSKIDDLQFSILSKLKALEAKSEAKMQEMDKNNNKLTSMLKKIQSFSGLIDSIKQEVEENREKLNKKIEDSAKKAVEYTNDQIAKLVKQNSKLQKNHEKKIATVYDKIDKLEDYFLQKIDFMKMQIQSQMSSKTVKILEQKSKTQQSISSSTMEEINSKINKHQMETKQQIAKLENNLKESLGEFKESVQQFKDSVQSKIQQKEYMNNGSVGNNLKIQNVNVDLSSINQQIKGAVDRILQLELANQSIQQSTADLKKKLQNDFLVQDEKLNSKVEKVMFLVTKMRGDSIIRNEFNDKQIKQMKRSHVQMRERLQITWKLLPGIGECINLIMSLIYDAEYQHSRIIMDSLPQLSKDAQKFNTVYEGVLYEFKDKKKPGCIFYRHNEIKKTDIVKATFNGYIQIWEEIYEIDLKNKQHLLPKGFYKRAVERHFKMPYKSSNQKQILPLERMVSTSVHLKSTTVMPDVNNRQSESNSRHPSQSNTQSMNSTFHIRKKRPNIIHRDKDQTPSEQMNFIRQ